MKAYGKNRTPDVTFFMPNLQGGGAERVMVNIAKV